MYYLALCSNMNRHRGYLHSNIILVPNYKKNNLKNVVADTKAPCTQ